MGPDKKPARDETGKYIPNRQPENYNDYHPTAPNDEHDHVQKARDRERAAEAADEARQDEKYNPGEKYAQREFGSGHLNQQRLGSNADDVRDAEQNPGGAKNNKNVGQAERKADNSKAFLGPSSGGGGGASLMAGGVAGLAANAVKFLTKHKKAGTGTVLVVVLLMLVAFNLATPAGIMIAIKEVLSRWPMRDAEIGMSHRTIKMAKSRYFGFPECKGGKWKCRHQKGMSPKELEKFKKAGFSFDENDKYTRNGKTFYKKMTFIDADGRKVDIDGRNFERVMRELPAVRARFNKVLSSRSFLARSANSLSKLKTYFVNRKNPAGNENDSKESRWKKMRAYIYQKTGLAKLKAAEISENDEETNKPRSNTENARRAFDEANEEADRVNRAAMEGSQSPNDIASARGLAGDEAAVQSKAKRVMGAVKGGLKGLFTGVFTSLDGYCTVYQIVRMVALTAKVLVVAQLIKYALIFLTVADQIKAGDGGNGTVVSDVASILLRPSTEEESAMKTFSDSPGWIGITQSGLIDRESMMRFVTGGAIMLFFNRIKKFMDVSGMSPQTCRIVKSWYGQAGIIVGGLITSLLSFGSGLIVGVAVGVAKGLMQMLIMMYGVPYVTQMAAGTVSPDPAKDPAGGYGAGNAIGAGVAALGGEMAKSNGMPPMTTAQAAYIHRTTLREQKTMADADAIENRERGIFSPMNPNSFQNQFALAMLPYTSNIIAGQNNLAATLLNGGRLLQTAFSTVPAMFTRTAGAIEGIDPNSLQAYRGDGCPDEDIRQLNLVATFTCAEVRGPTKLGLGASEAGAGAADAALAAADPSSAESITQWLNDHNYLDAETGEEGDDLEKFQKVCIKSVTTPLTADGFNIDGTNQDGQMCTSQDQKYEYFWTYVTDKVVDKSIDQTKDDSLGLEQPGQTGETEGKTENVNL